MLVIVTRAPHNTLMIANRTGVIFAIDLLTLAVAVLLDLVLIPQTWQVLRESGANWVDHQPTSASAGRSR